jgi:hypothetical protein
VSDDRLKEGIKVVLQSLDFATESLAQSTRQLLWIKFQLEALLAGAEASPPLIGQARDDYPFTTENKEIKRLIETIWPNITCDTTPKEKK